MLCILKLLVTNLLTEFLPNMSRDRSALVTIELDMSFHYASKHRYDFLQGIRNSIALPWLGLAKPTPLYGVESMPCGQDESYILIIENSTPTRHI